LVDKPGRRKKHPRPWSKIVGVALAALVVVGVAWFVYNNYVYSPPPEYARIGTSFGYIYAELYPSCAPKTVANFAHLAGTGFYDNLVWHRIVPGFVIQTGDPNTRNGVNSTRSTWGQGGSNQTVPLETCSWLHNYAGYIGMARQGNQTSGLNTGTSQFYIILDNNTQNELALDGYYTIFGKVMAGMNVVCTIAKVPTYYSTYATQPVNPVYVKNVTMLTAATAPIPQPIVGCK
jgi:dolichyl-diphosphooligosaccharide--protein glycosyltransferase